MSPPSTLLATSRRMGIYDPLYQIGMWGNTYKDDSIPSTVAVASTVVLVDSRLDNKVENTSHESLGPLRSDQEADTSSDKVRRRLAQNREAARKSRLRKKAYVQQLETSRLKLTQIEQELDKAKQQGVCIGVALDSTSSHIGLSGTVNSGIIAFQMEYKHWVEEQQRQSCELRNALHAHITDVELYILVESVLNHYKTLFRIKADAAKADVFYLTSGIWRTSAERFFLWLGGFRPSELLNVLLPQLEPLTEQQLISVCTLRQSSQQAEDALTQGMDKLQQTLAQNLLTDLIGEGSYSSQMAIAIENLEAVESFVIQADHLRQQTLQQMSRILTTRQAARGLLALGEYFDRFRALSSLWAARPPVPA